MAEKTVADPLSGAEVKAAILDRIKTALDHDCFLHDSASYDFFTGTVKISLSCHDGGFENKVELTAAAAQGDPVVPATEANVEIDLEKAPPNQVRVETGQPVPTASGKKIKYSRKTAKAAQGV
jgi:hypothetical protein